ncbi:MAG: hypothetical protein PF487_01670 [Bacteroidales bacterium]|nr:hypothetical protein [Bacteroidales bacterium]
MCFKTGFVDNGRPAYYPKDYLYSTSTAILIKYFHQEIQSWKVKKYIER